MLNRLKKIRAGLLESISKRVHRCIEETEREYTLDDMVRYFINNKPLQKDNVRGTLLRERNSHGYKLTHLFIDSQGYPVLRDNGAPYGMKMNVRNLDSELEYYFGDSDMLVME